MKTKILLPFLAFAVTSGVALAASRTVTLDVQNMACAVCPIRGSYHIAAKSAIFVKK